MWQHLVKEGVFKSVEHRYLIVGHTHLPSDKDFASIEKYKKRMCAAHDPQDWYTAVKSKRKNPLKVQVMTRNDFYAFKVLEGSIKKKTITDDGQNVSFSRICCLRFDHNNPNIMKIKHTVKESLAQWMYERKD